MTSVIAAPDLNNFLDDDNDGTEDSGLFDATVAAAQMTVDAMLAGIYSVPFSTIPPLAAQATLIFFCEILYSKRLTPDQVNPYKARADMMRKTLNTIRENGTGLDQSIDRAFTPGYAAICPVSLNGTMA